MNSLIVMSDAEKLLAEATTIQKAKELKNVALTSADWAKRKGMGKKVVSRGVLYGRLASIRMAEIYVKSEKAK